VPSVPVVVVAEVAEMTRSRSESSARSAALMSKMMQRHCFQMALVADLSCAQELHPQGFVDVWPPPPPQTTAFDGLFDQHRR